MNKLIALILFATQAWAGLPPTTSHISGDSNNVTTFNFQFPNLSGTHTGTTVSLPIYAAPSPSPSSILMDVSNAWTPVAFPSPSPSGQLVMATGSGFGLSNNLLWDNFNSRLGIGTTVPVSSLDIETGSILANGTTGTLPATGAGTRFEWVPSFGAIRAGVVNSTQWDSGNMGTWSVAFGANTKASGSASMAMNNATTAAGNFSNAFGSNTTASGTNSTSSGDHVTADAFDQFTVGAYNNPTGTENAGSWVLTDPLFVVGNGTGSGAKANAVMVLKNGNTTISGTLGASNLSGTNTGDVTLTAVGASPSANGASLSGQSLTLQPFDGTHPGVVTASGGGTTNFLRADGTWASAAGGTPAGVSGNVQYNSSGSFAASNNLFWDIGNSRLGIGTSTPSVALDVNGAVRDRNLSTAGIVSTDASGNLASASNASTFTTLYETIATTLGDLVYGGASGAPTRLAGNTQNSGYVLTSQASGGVATAPSWQPVSAIGISTDWAAYTPTIAGAGTISAASIWQRRVGDTLEVRGVYTVGTPSGSTAAIPLPSGLTIDSAKFSNANSTQMVGGGSNETTAASGAYVNGTGHIYFYDGSDTSNVYIGYQTTTHAIQKIAGNSLWTASDVSTFKFSVPISSWSSNTIGASQGAVGATYYLSANWGGGANTSIPYDTKIVDTGCGGGTCIATGVGGTFKLTAPVTGNYAIDVCNAIASATSTNFQLYVNGSRVAYMDIVTATSTTTTCGSIIYPLTVGDFVDLRPDSGATIKGGAAGAILNWISFNLQSGNGSGNISSASTNSFHIESASIAGTGSTAWQTATACNSGTCATFNSSTSGWISFAYDGITGNYTGTIAAGTFSAIPNCTCSWDGAGADTYCELDSAGRTLTSTFVHVHATANGGFTIICMGPK